MELLGGKGTFSSMASLLLRITIALLQENSTLFCLLHGSMERKGNRMEFSSYLVLYSERGWGCRCCLKGKHECSKSHFKEAHSNSLHQITPSFFQPGKRKWAGVCSVERYKSLLEHVNSAFLQGFFSSRKK